MQGGPAAEGPNYFQMTQDLRLLGALLSKLEGAIATLAASAGNNGYTAKGEFLFDLLAKIGLNADNHFYMERLLDEAADLLGSAAAEQGRKCVMHLGVLSFKIHRRFDPGHACASSS